MWHGRLPRRSNAIQLDCGVSILTNQFCRDKKHVLGSKLEMQNARQEIITHAIKWPSEMGIFVAAEGGKVKRPGIRSTGSIHVSIAFRARPPPSLACERRMGN